MHERLWFDLHATVLHAEHALSRRRAAAQTPTEAAPTTIAGGTAEPALILHADAGTGTGASLAGNGVPPLWATPPVPAVHLDLADGVRAAVVGTYRLPLRTRTILADGPLRDLLRRGAYAGHAWFTVEVDPAGLRQVATRAARDGETVPADAVWCDARLTAAGLGTYPGQTCPGYHRHGSDPARFQPHVLHRLLADTCCSHNNASPVSAEHDGDTTWLVDEIGDRTQVTADPDHWWQVAHPTLTWAARPVAETGPGGVFQPWAPDGEGIRCTVCGAVNEIDHLELPSMAGYDLDTYTTCTICGSSEATDPVFGWRPHPKPWPPAPGQPHTSPAEATLR